VWRIGKEESRVGRCEMRRSGRFEGTMSSFVEESVGLSDERYEE
jgi:hypothetical protein